MRDEKRHTPGPWVKDYTNIYNTTHGCLDKLIAEVNTHRDEYDSNAVLIASAPDLLAERDKLRGVVGKLVEAADLKRNVIICDNTPREFKGNWVAVPREDFDNLRSAIANARKVRGEE